MPTAENADDGSVADLTPEAVSTMLSISEVAEATGLTGYVLRVWENRYKWPRPHRLPNGYRVYPITLVPLLRAISAELENGKSIGDLLRDPLWSARMEAGRMPDPVEKPRPDWSRVPQPQSPEARRLRAVLEQALEHQDRGTIARVEAEGMRLRASEREAAITAVVRHWQELGH